MSNDDNDRLRRIIQSEEETQGERKSKSSGGTTPPQYRPMDNTPLPRRVDEVDVEGTRVTRAAFEPPSKHLQPQQEPKSQGRSRPLPEALPPAKPPPFNWRGSMGCFLRVLIVMAFVVVIVGLCMGSIFVYQYNRIASTLPEIGDLRERASQFETTRILDRNGQVLYEILDPNAGRRTYIPIEDISPNLVAATIATEDKEFYTNPGFDPVAIVRALWRNYTTGGQGGGASTITQQLARALLLSPEERSQRTVTRKAREIILAAEITRRYSKDDILELYLNEIYYGNLAYGVQAAAETYFGKSAKDLTMGEAAFLAGLPQSPAVYDIYTNPEPTLLRQQQVLVLMFELSAEQGCIKVSNKIEPICIDPFVATQAADEMKTYSFRPPSFDAKYPHWVNYVRSQLEAQYDPQVIYRSGFVVYTTLDPVLQDKAQEYVSAQIASLTENNTHNGALVAIRPVTGEILAMVGSPDFNNVAISGQINMATSPTRQPGSSIKPFTYVAAFEKGWTPSTLIWDVPTQFPDGANPPYEPRNYDGKFHGAMTMRIALSNSFNIPAVKALEFVGIYDDPATPQKDGLIGMAERLGITSLTRNDYGLSLTLGGGDVSLIDMTSAYSVFANGGRRMPPVSILKITDYAGNVVYEYKPQEGEQVIRAEHAYLISSILSDNESRSLMFGPNSLLNLSFPVAAKTGTTNDIRDNWTIGYTPDLVTGVWIGNADYTPMINSTGLSGAAPIWRNFMEYAVPYLTSGAPTPFNRPPGVVDVIVCRLSGTEPGNMCDSQYTEVFASDQPPLKSGQDLARRIKIDLWTGLQSSDACEGPKEEAIVFNVNDKWARDWLGTNPGRNWLENHDLPLNVQYAPERECNADDPQPILEFKLNDGQSITSLPFDIKGSADAEDGIERWVLDLGLGADPSAWHLVIESNTPVRNGTLYTWDATDLQNGLITLRLTLFGKRTEVEKRVILNLNLPAPTEIPLTPTTTPVPTIPSLTPIPTSTPTPTSTPFITIITILPTSTPTPTESPTETPTEAPTEIPTETPTVTPT
ncbi:MAG: PBP1A family penicillin-binding protein [Chloroflexi bacterium]|nr:PBP1A family penicillin-binding protein [Chloroflexota bacterium]